MKALRCFKMSVTSYQLSCHNIPEDLNLQWPCCKNFIWVEGNYIISHHFRGGTCGNSKELRWTEFMAWDTNAVRHWFGIREGPLYSSVQHLLHFIQNSGMVLTASHYPSEWTALSLWCSATTGSAVTVVLIFVCVHVHWWERVHWRWKRTTCLPRIVGVWGIFDKRWIGIFYPHYCNILRHSIV